MKTVLIYVVSCNRPPYSEMIKTSMRTWDSIDVDGTQAYYYCGSNEKHDGRVLHFKCEDDFHLMGYKNLLAFHWALSNLKWDYMARVNSSCYVHKGNLLSHIQALPSNGVIQGLISDHNFASGINYPFMWGGGGIIMSRDVVNVIVGNSNLWNHSIAEDVAMSVAAQQIGYHMDGSGSVLTINPNPYGYNCLSYKDKSMTGVQIKELSELSQFQDHHFFRVKCEAERHRDAELMDALFNNLKP